MKTTLANLDRVAIDRPEMGAIEITRQSAGQYGIRIAKKGAQGWSSRRDFSTDTAFGAWLQSAFTRSQPMQYLEVPK